MVRFELEGLHKDEAFTNPKGDFYQKKIEFALYKFSYYLCYKCENPYFTGMVDCVFEADQEEEKLQKDQLLCSECRDLSNIEGITECEYHGREYIVWKCRFCCNVSKFFCWGTTHFCKDCHTKQLNKDYLTKKSINEFPQCPGIDKCPLKMKHARNGEEFGIKCLLCDTNSNSTCSIPSNTDDKEKMNKDKEKTNDIEK